MGTALVLAIIFPVGFISSSCTGSSCVFLYLYSLIPGLLVDLEVSG